MKGGLARVARLGGSGSGNDFPQFFDPSGDCVATSPFRGGFKIERN